MLEAEISPQGDVTVEGHHVGALNGFRFTADHHADGEDAKAVRSAAQKALASEYESRAERFAAAPNGDLALGSDGTLRWLGAPVAKVVGGQEMLKPRIILLADEQLAGAVRDRVQARAERYVAYQIETHLKPLLQLVGDESLSGIAKGIAFRLAENCGFLNRRNIAEEMRALDQEGRAALRRLGVRFGAYHVFVPTLIKPAPASLLTLLWAISNDATDRPGFGDVSAALSTGRTSLAVDPAFERNFYRLSGFRLLGRRAVRIDILERLADLIRPALHWKSGTEPKPDGAHDGRSFIVTPAMMSILGATAEDMEEILKSLGYRAEPLRHATDEAAPATEAPAESKAESVPEPETSAESQAEDAGQQDAASPEAIAAEVPSQEETGTGDQEQAAAGSAPSEEAAPEKPVLLWRPAGRHSSRPARSASRQQEPGRKRPRPDKKLRTERSEHAPRHKSPPKPVRDKKPQPVDPDSPFAKLAALRDQLSK